MRSDSICTGPDGIMYGQHGDGHWHVAVEYPSGFYPNGGAISSNPCTGTNTAINYNTNQPPEIQVNTAETSFEEYPPSNFNKLIKKYEIIIMDDLDGEITLTEDNFSYDKDSQTWTLTVVDSNGASSNRNFTFTKHTHYFADFICLMILSAIGFYVYNKYFKS